MKGLSSELQGETDGPGKRIIGSSDGTGLKIGIVAARYSYFITGKLVSGACNKLLAQGVKDDDITICWVPGSFEIPVVASEMAKSGNWDSIICLGAVIKGDTAHFDYVAGEAARRISQISVETGIPVVFGVLTTFNVEQAIERSGDGQGNKGEESATVAIETANLLSSLKTDRKY